MLSTDLLNLFYRKEIFPSREREGCVVLLHWFGEQVELLFFENHTFVQSRWLSTKGGDQITSLSQGIEASFTAFQREWRLKPETAYLLGEVPPEAESLIKDSTIQTERMAVSEEGANTLPLLVSQAAQAYSSREAFDFMLPEVKEARKIENRTLKRSRLATSIACFALSLFLLGFLQLTILLGTMTWFWLRTGQLERSVKEVKAVRNEALLLRDFDRKKSTPLFLLGALRRAIPDTLFLRELEYHEGDKKLLVRGVAPGQSEIDGFVGALEREALLEGLAIGGLQVQRNEEGSSAYHFSMEGSVKS
jgi:hypothetical protein